MVRINSRSYCHNFIWVIHTIAIDQVSDGGDGAHVEDGWCLWYHRRLDTTHVIDQSSLTVQSESRKVDVLI